ncbi:MAG: hypothetical protein LBP62_01510 [Clostridiales bacterium]|jgi:hypothetical protein|nr:hypothetical protein [Clostridiales bacterium]
MITKCYIHSECEAVGICSRCGKPICKDCLVEVKGKNFCKNCLDFVFDENKSDKDRPIVFMNAGGGGASSSSSSASSAAASDRGVVPPYPVNSIGVHIILFCFTAGLGNVIYYLWVKSRQEEWKRTYGGR